jgi:hypothetical protein
VKARASAALGLTKGEAVVARTQIQASSMPADRMQGPAGSETRGLIVWRLGTSGERAEQRNGNLGVCGSLLLARCRAIYGHHRRPRDS